MKRARSRPGLGVLALAAVWLVLGSPAVEAADPAPGGTLVLGLDQEPPTLDPHASPSAVTYQVRSPHHARDEGLG